MLIIANIQYWFLGIQVLNLNGPPMGLLFGLKALLLSTLVSLLFVGWFTLPFGAFTGWIYARRICARETGQGHEEAASEEQTLSSEADIHKEQL